jgi:hypothetical protein
VVEDGAWHRLAERDSDGDRSTVDLDAILCADAEPQFGWTAIDTDATGAYPVLDLATRSVSGARKDFLQTFCH